MPVRNGEKFISSSIDSVLNQTHNNWELLIIDDHSTDSTTLIVTKYTSNYNKIILYKNQKKGIIPALQTGYKQCTGHYITRMDSDDIMPKEKLSLMLSAIKSKPNTIVTGKVKYFNTQGRGYILYEKWINNLCDNKNHYEEIYKECVIPSCCWMLSKHTFDKIGSFNNLFYPEDYHLAFRFYKHKIPVLALKETLHHWRDHAERASRNDPNYLDNTFITLKINQFIKLDYNSHKKLILWGAGNKAKQVAQKTINDVYDIVGLYRNEA